MDESRQCSAITRAGTRCKGTALDSSEYCWAHSRETAEQRREYARAGGYARSRRPPDELEKIKQEIRTVTAAVLKGGLDQENQTVDKHTAAVLFQGFNTLLRSIEIQRRFDYQEQLENEVADLRGRLQELKRLRYGSA
jgi:hypothetical protein